MVQWNGAMSEAEVLPAERRQDRRIKTLKSGQIVYRDGHVVECSVLDMSEGGARLKTGNLFDCPGQFTLRVRSGYSYRCRLVWRSKQEVGVRFLTAELPKVLLVDDDDNARAIWDLELKKHFDVHCAAGPKEGLAALAELGPFAVVLSDMRMPNMDGTRFLAAVAHQAPDTVRIMLTGYADLSTAMDAINSGHVYRFLTKPCALDDLVSSVREGVEEYQRQ